MTILIISRGTPSNQDPQWGSFEFDQAKALMALGHKVIIASVDMRFRLYWRKIGMTISEKDGIKTYNIFICPIAIINLLGSYISEYYTAYLWHWLERVIMQNTSAIDVIYTHYLVNSRNALRYFQNIQAPIVGIEHWSEINQNILRPSIKKMGEETYSKLACLISVSNTVKESLIRHFGIDSIVVPNMFPPGFKYIPRKENTSKDKIIFIAVSSLRPLKGYDVLINALSKAQLPPKKWELIIIGNGKEEKRIKRLINSNGLQDSIKLLGQKNQLEIIQYLQQSDVFVLASRSETFGVAYIEALACGLPVIATRCGGPEEFVTKENGLLVPVDDVESLANAIDFMFQNYKEYDKEIIAKNCNTLFSSEAIARRLSSIFEEIVSN